MIPFINFMAVLHAFNIFFDIYKKYSKMTTGFATQRTRKLLQTHGLSKVHDSALYDDYYDYLETYYSSKVDILPLKR